MLTNHSLLFRFIRNSECYFLWHVNILRRNFAAHFLAPEIRRIFVRGSCHGYLTEGFRSREELMVLPTAIKAYTYGKLSLLHSANLKLNKNPIYVVLSTGKFLAIFKIK